MTILLEPEVEAKIVRQAKDRGADPNTYAAQLLQSAAELEDSEFESAVAGIQRGLDAVAAGRVRPASDVMNKLHSLPIPRPELTTKSSSRM